VAGEYTVTEKTRPLVSSHTVTRVEATSGTSSLGIGGSATGSAGSFDAANVVVVGGSVDAGVSVAGLELRVVERATGLDVDDSPARALATAPGEPSRCATTNISVADTPTPSDSALRIPLRTRTPSARRVTVL